MTTIEDIIRYLNEETHFVFTNSTDKNDDTQSVMDYEWNVKVMIPNSLIPDAGKEWYSRWVINAHDMEYELVGIDKYDHLEWDTIQEVVAELNDIHEKLEERLHEDAKALLDDLEEKCSLDEVELVKYSGPIQSVIRGLLRKFKYIDSNNRNV